MKAVLLFLAAALSLAALSAVPQKPPAPRVHLDPQFTPGMTLRYQIEFRTVTESKAEGPIENPQAANQLELTFSATVRLEVLRPVTPTPAKKSADAPQAPSLRLRATYEKCAVSVRGDAFDPAAGDLAEQYRRLEGRAVEFSLGPDKTIANVTGLSDLPEDQRAVANTQNWITELARGVVMPKDGVLPGQTWKGDQPVAQAPLAGLAWRTETTYLRDEPCQPANVPEGKRTAGEVCAVLLTRFEMTQPDSSDPTPPDYRRRGLRTSGKMTGSGESLNYISLRTGHLVSATQNVAQEMDLTITHLEADSRVHYAGRVTNRSNIALLK